ncbi:uncharacterized protein rab44 isoform X1 [Xyrichtys novacula]|uniref:Uncharacterized protein rab44 isoform X1 n=1 Tax=Xyrichtys novacula TaxID=13765 RepID=A0AAV1EPN7_XYRNO|nr:uncharacterized protein rab44 isoform X1 [Xyrichtys novacula]
MSTAKKKRIGSRRRVTNQNKTSEDDEFLAKDSSAVTQQNKPERSPESVGAFAHLDHLSSLTQNPPSPELSGNRRKFGSSQRNKGRHVRDSATELRHSPTEEVEEKTKSIESPERTQMSAAIQPEKQETFSQGSEHDMSGTYESLLCLSEEKLPNVRSAREIESNDVEVNTEVLKQGGNFHSNYLSESKAELAATQFAASQETTTDESSAKDHTEVDLNVQETFKPLNEELSTEQEQRILIRVSEDYQPLYDDVSKATEEEMKQTQNYKMENSEGLVHDRHASENLSRDPLDQAEARDTQDLDFTEKSMADSDDFAKPDGPVLHEKEDKQPEKDNFEAFDNKEEDEPQTSDTDRVDTELESEITIPDPDLSRSTLGVLQSEINSLVDFQPQDSCTTTKDEHDTDLNPFRHRRKLGSSRKHNVRQQVEDPAVESEINSLVDFQPQDSCTTTKDEHDTDLNPFRHRRKLGSSRKHNVRQQVEDPAVESYYKPTLEVSENTEGTQEFRGEMSFAAETAVQEKSMQSTLKEMVKSDPHQTEGQESEIQQFLGTVDENSPEDHPGTEDNTEKAKFASHTGEWSPAEEQIDALPVGQGAHQSRNAESTVHATEIVQTQEMFETDHSFENVIYDEIVSRSPLNQEICDTLGQSDFSMETNSDSSTKQDNSNPDATQGEHSTRESDANTFVPRNDDYDEKPVIMDGEKVDTGLGQIDSREEGDTKLSPEQTVQLERLEESETFQTLESEIRVSANFQPLQPNCSLDSPAADSNQKPAEEKDEETEDNETLETKIISSTSETASMDFLIETTAEEVDTFDTASPKDISDEVKCQEDVGTPTDVSELTSSSLHSSLTAGQNLDIQQDEELPYSYSETIEERDEDSTLLKSHVNLQNNHSECETYPKSEDTDSFVVLETTTETSRPKELKHPESNMECTDFGSFSEELGTSETQNKIFNCSFDSSAADSNQKPAEEKVEETEDNEPLETKIISLTSETSLKDFSIETTVEEVNTFDTALPKDVSDDIKCEADEERDEDSTLLKSHVNLETCLKSEDTDSFVVLETTTETSSPKELTDPESNIECTEFSSLSEELAQNEIFSFVEVTGVLHPSNAFTEVHEQGEEIQEINKSSERTADETTGNPLSGEPEMMEQNIDPASMQDTPDTDDSLLNNMKTEEVHSDAKELDTITPCDGPSQDPPHSYEEQTCTGFNPIKSRKKMGSSRRYKDQKQFKDPEHMACDKLETSQTEKDSQEELSQGSEYASIMPVTHEGPSALIHSGVQSPTSDNHPETDLQSFIHISKSVQQDHDDRGTDFRVEESDKPVDVTLDEEENSNIHQKADLKGACHSEESLGEVHVQDVVSQPMQEVLQTNIYSENLMSDETEYAEKKLGGLIAEAEVGNTYESDLTIKRSDGSQGEQEGSQLYDILEEETINDVSREASDLGKAVYHGDTKNLHQIEKEEGEAIAAGHSDETEVCKDYDIKPCDEKTGFQEKEGVFFGVEEGESSNSQDQQVDYEQNKSTAVEAHRGLMLEDFQEALLHTIILPKEDIVVREQSMDTISEGVDTADTTLTEEVGDDAQDGTLVSERSCLSLNSAQEQLLKVGYTQEEEKKERDMEEESFRLDGNLLGSDVVTDYDLAQELAVKKKQSGKNTENESIVEQTACSMSQGLLSRNEEEKEHFTSSQVTVTCHSGDTTHEILEELIQVRDIHEIMAATTETESTVEAQQCDINFSLDSEPQQIDDNVNPLRTRRKMGSSRRNRRQQKDTEASDKSQEVIVEKEGNDDALHVKTTYKFAMDNIKLEEVEEHTNVYPSSTVEIGEDKENPDAVLPGSLIDSGAITTTPITLSLGRDNLAESCQGMNEDENIQPRNLSALTSHETVKFVLRESAESACKDDSDMQNTSCHDDIANARSFSPILLEQEDDFDQNKEALSYDKDIEISMQQTNDAIDTEGHATVHDNYTEADTSMEIPLTDKDEHGENFQEPMKKDHKAQDIMASKEIIPTELFSASHKSDSSAQLDAGLVANIRVESPVAVTKQSGTSTAVSAMDSLHEVQEQTASDDSETLEEKSKHRKRRFGSNRRIKHKVNQEEAPPNKDQTSNREFSIPTGAKESEKIKVIEEFPVHVSAEVSQGEKIEPSQSSVSIIQQETDETSSVLDKGPKLLISTPDPEKVESSMISDKKVMMSSVTEEYGVTGESGVSLDETTQDAQIEEERPGSIDTTQNRALESVEGQFQAVGDSGMRQSVDSGGEEMQKSAEVCTLESSTVDEEGQNTSLDVKDSNPVFGSTSQRRKFGSSRKILKPKDKADSSQKHEVRNEAVETTTNAEDEKTGVFSDIKEVLQLNIDQKDRESKDQVCDTDKNSLTEDSHLTPLAQQSSVENSLSKSQQQETKLLITPQNLPTMLSTSPKEDVMSESASGGRRRKMGSNRKSRQHQRNGNQTEKRIEDTQNGPDGDDATEESAVKTTEESQSLPETSEAEKPNLTAESPHSSTSEAGQDIKPVSEKTSVQATPVKEPNTEICLGQETQKTVSLGVNTGGAAGRSKSFNVVMVGDSSVGKTSFMRRAQSGKFSLEIPASIGLDSCLWTVVVDGKPVVLQLWDTAGQERFHSITRQVFHRAQAFLLMYDVTSSQSFSAVSYWASCIQDGAAEDVTVLLLGNKSDHVGRRVTAQAGESLAKEYNFGFMECSAATGENVIHSLETIARMLDQKDDTREEASVRFEEPQKKKSSGCC